MASAGKACTACLRFPCSPHCRPGSGKPTPCCCCCVPPPWLQIWANCLQYNGPDHPVTQEARQAAAAWRKHCEKGGLGDLAGTPVALPAAAAAAAAPATAPGPSGSGPPSRAAPSQAVPTLAPASQAAPDWLPALAPASQPMLRPAAGFGAAAAGQGSLALSLAAASQWPASGFGANSQGVPGAAPAVAGAGHGMQRPASAFAAPPGQGRPEAGQGFGPPGPRIPRPASAFAAPAGQGLGSALPGLEPLSQGLPGLAAAFSAGGAQGLAGLGHQWGALSGLASALAAANQAQAHPAAAPGPPNQPGPDSASAFGRQAPAHSQTMHNPATAREQGAGTAWEQGMAGLASALAAANQPIPQQQAPAWGAGSQGMADPAAAFGGASQSMPNPAAAWGAGSQSGSDPAAAFAAAARHLFP